MDSEVARYREIIARIFDEWIAWPGPEAKFRLFPVMDDANRRYILQEMGWDGSKRIYSTFFHLDIIDGKIWVQHDNTEEGIAEELVNAGVPKNKIVLGFKSLERRKITEFAVA